MIVKKKYELTAKQAFLMETILRSTSNNIKYDFRENVYLVLNDNFHLSKDFINTFRELLNIFGVELKNTKNIFDKGANKFC